MLCNLCKERRSGLTVSFVTRSAALQKSYQSTVSSVSTVSTSSRVEHNKVETYLHFHISLDARKSFEGSDVLILSKIKEFTGAFGV